MSNEVNIRDVIIKILQEYHSPTIYSEHLFNKLIIEAWKHGIIKQLKLKKEEFISILNEHGWIYDSKNHYWYRGDKKPDYLF